ncbi:hypothetical protein ACFYVR_18810 [Rhodococcus sp. NPDC003318]|uniref:hypothetical protein n=1 Tax=Rhodococcus sp. NPDC003318 TaxID=3364503 RepID=UPI0036B21AA4
MTASATPALPRRTTTHGGSMRTEEIKARIEAMYADRPAPAPRRTRESRSA